MYTYFKPKKYKEVVYVETSDSKPEVKEETEHTEEIIEQKPEEPPQQKQQQQIK